MPEWQDRMDAAAEDAKAELCELRDSLTRDEWRGVGVVSEWIRDNYQSAGYKRLGRILREMADNDEYLNE